MVRLLALVAFAVLCARPAQAQGAFFDGNPLTISTPCSATGGQAYIILNVSTGYFTDGTTFPKTGDIVYVRARAVNTHPCDYDTVGFDFFLPDGASPAVSVANPVQCTVGRIGQPPSENVVPLYGACLQVPETGNFGGLFYGYSKVAHGYYVDIRFPVVFNKKLLGIGGPPSHRLVVGAKSIYGELSPLLQDPVSQAVTVFYQASFSNLAASGVTASAATLTYDLESYFESGILFIDYGTTPSFGSSLAGVAVPNTAVSFPVTSSLSGLSASTTYYWRARFVTSSGTFSSATQSFMTGGASTQLLTVNTGGTGAGTVTSSPTGISCGVVATCTANFPSGTMVALTATPATGSRLAAWSGACSGTGACSVTMNSAQTVNASIMRDQGSLSVILDGLPAGTSVDLAITGPDAYNLTRSLTTGFGFNLSDVPTGMYMVTAPNTTVLGTAYAAPSQGDTVNFGTTSTIHITYTQQGTPPPTDVVATVVLPAAVTITWVGVKGTTYEVQRVAANGASTTVGSSETGTVVDKTAAPNTAYLYKVRAILPSVSVYSAPDLATTVIFTDPTLTATTQIKAAHINELRTAINAVRTLAGLGAGVYTDPTLTVGVTTVKAAHLTDLRSALASARLTLALPAITYTPPTLAAGLAISAAHVNELRAAVR
jgi:hypothetical protein